MSRATLLLVFVLTLGIAALLFFGRDQTTVYQPPTTNAEIMAAAPPIPASSPPPAPQVTPAPQHALAPEPTPTPTVQSITGLVVNPTVPADPGDAPRPVATVEAAYRKTKDLDERMDMILELAEQPGVESIQALNRLFLVETNQDLQIDLLDALQGMEGFNTEKMALLSQGLQAGRDEEVRLAAIDGFIALEDPQAIPLLKNLLNDPSEIVRQTAEDAIELLKDVQEEAKADAEQPPR